MVSENGLLTKGPTHDFINNNLIAVSGATCYLRGSLEGMYNLKLYVTDIMVVYNEMASVSNHHYRGLVLQNDGTSVDITIK
jgi:hypothetical protein